MNCCFPRLSSPSSEVPADSPRFPSRPPSHFVAPASSRLFFGVRRFAAAFSSLSCHSVLARLQKLEFVHRHRPALGIPSDARDLLFSRHCDVAGSLSLGCRGTHGKFPLP